MDTQTAESLPLTPPPENSPSDDTLQRARRGDLTAFRELLRIHKVRVFSIALRILGNSADAEEVAQDVFLQLYSRIGRISTTSHLKNWLLRAVSHRCIDRLRTQGSRPRLVSIDGLPEVAQGTAAEEGVDMLAVAQVRRLVRELSPEARAVMLLRFQEELAPSEIATVLAISKNTVKSHLRRSLQWLRAQLQGDGNGS